MSETNASSGETTSKTIPNLMHPLTVAGIGEDDKSISTKNSAKDKESSVKEHSEQHRPDNVDFETLSISSKATTSSRVSSASKRSSVSSKNGEIVILPNGKKVRRVKKSESKKYRETRKAERQEKKQQSVMDNGFVEVRSDASDGKGKQGEELITTRAFGALTESIPFEIKEECENMSPRSSHQVVGDTDDNGKGSNTSPLDAINAVTVDQNHENNEKGETARDKPPCPIVPPLKVVEVRSTDDQDHSISQQESKILPTALTPSEIKTSFHDHIKTQQQHPLAPLTPEKEQPQHRVVNFPDNDPIIPSTPPPTTSSPRNNIESTIKMKKTQISQSLLARTRSRAEVETLSPVNGRDVNAEERNPLASRSPTGRPDESLFLKPNLAKKRTKVVQLLVFGLLGIVGGFFGSIFVQSTCNFANAIVTVGQYDNSFKVHLGLWTYSPIDSVFQGYSYCWPYDDSYTSKEPVFPRITGLTAMISGSIALCVLWVYLILGVTNDFFWTGAVKVFTFTGICQLFTFSFFLDSVCSEATCYFGPGAFICLVCSIIWFILAYEMHNNAPVSALLPFLPSQSTKNDLMNLELPDMHERIKNRWNRLPFKAAQEEVPSLSTFTKKNQCDRYERMVNDCHSNSSPTSNDNNSNGSYFPPRMNGVV